jgi:hypothetical protein
VSLPRDDLDLIDALVWAHVITRETARDVAERASPGRVATYIGEKGIHSVHAFSHLLIERIARGEPASDAEMAAFRREVMGEQPETD